MEQFVRKVVIPVAGLGTRSLPFTKVVAKELLPVIDTPTIHFIVEEAIQAGIEQVVFVTSQGKTALEDYFKQAPALVKTLRDRGKHELAEKVEALGKKCEVTSVLQDKPLGLGHAILCAESVVGDEMFAVALGDEIFPPWDKSEPPLKILGTQAQQRGISTIGVMEVASEETRKYGVVDVGGATMGTEALKVRGTVEKPDPASAPSRYAIIGRYVFDPIIFKYLRDLKPGVGGEYQLTDAMAQLCQAPGMFAYPVAANRFDMGSPFGFIQAQLQAGLQRPDLEDPLKAYIKDLCEK